MRAWLLPSLASCLVVCACPPTPTLEDAGHYGDPLWPDGSVELGTPAGDLDLTFVPFASQLELHGGAQGGYHVPVLYRVTGQQQPSAIFTHRVARSRDGVLVSKGNRTFDVTTGTDGTWTSDYPVTIFLCPTPVGVNVLGEELTFEITVTTLDDALLTRTTGKATVSCPGGGTSCEAACKG